MSEIVRDLYDYGELRRCRDATMFRVRVARPTLVLGGSQSDQVVDLVRLGSTPLRRRRGGGGLVLLHPNDLWIDWWIPTTDQRWSKDVRESSLMVGQWWANLLRDVTEGDLVVHSGSLEGDLAHRLVCFAGRGPGEVFVNNRKAVGVTQWRVREGMFLSTVLHAHSSVEILDFLTSTPPGLLESLDHQVLSTLNISDADAATQQLRLLSGRWQFQVRELNF